MTYLGEVPVVGGQGQVELLRVVVDDDPGVHVVLVQVVVGAARDGVQVHQVVKVRDLPPLPLLHHARHLEELLRRGLRHAPGEEGNGIRFSEEG